MKKELLRNDKGEKLYPICSWEKNQHKIYNAYERDRNRCEEENWSDESVANLEYFEIAYDSFNANVSGGIVYATWREGNVIKDLCAGYDFRH